MNFIKSLVESNMEAARAEHQLQQVIAAAFNGKGNSQTIQNAMDQLAGIVGVSKAEMIKKHIVDSHKEHAARTVKTDEPFFRDHLQK